MIIVRANARNATYISDDLITSGSVGIPVTFNLSEDFDGLSAIAVFEGSSTARDVALIGNTCVVPHEVLATAGGYLRIGVYASNSAGTIVIPTVWAGSKMILQGTEPSEVDPSEPTPSWVAQVQAAAAEALENSDEAIEIAGGAQAAADDARESASAAAGSATAAEQSESAASGYATSASGSASAAAQSATGAASSASNAASSASAAAGSATAAAGSADAAAASEAAAREVEESIPADYSELSDDVSDLKSAIDDIIETVQSTNIFNQAGATVVEGKYLNYTNGNEGTNASYSYCADYIPVKSNTQYYGGVWRKSDGLYAGPYGAFVVFYDENKGYISGLSGSANQNPFTTPSNCAYMRLSFALLGWTDNNYMFVEGSAAPTSYVPYYSTKMLKLPFVVVDAGGSGNYTSISDAVTGAKAGSTIVVMPGVYEENVKAWGKKVHIIGLSREACVIKDSSGNYATPPLEIGAGSIQNMSIIEEANGAGTAAMGAYAIHVESNQLFNEALLIRNCYVYSDSSSAIGMGLRGGCSVRIEDCEIICAGARASTGAAPLYFHDADAQAYWGTANLYLHGNVLRNTASTLFSMLTINSIHKENTTYMHMMYNIFVRSKTPALSQKFNTWNTSGNTDADGWNGLSHMYLEDDSFGNNLTALNYSA